MRKNKKAAIEVSINTIIILIFAVVILSLGIVFVRKMFTDASKQFEDVSDSVKQMMVEKIQSSSSRLTFDYFEVSVKKNEQKELYYGIKNDLGTDQQFYINDGGTISNIGVWGADKSIINCFSRLKDDACANCNTYITFDAVKSRSIKSGEIFVHKLTIKVLGTAPSDSYSCAMIIEDPITAGNEYARTDFIVTVP